MILDRKFESIETSSGFAQGFSKLSTSKVTDRFMISEKNLLNDESLEMNVAISRKKLKLVVRNSALHRKRKLTKNVSTYCAYYSEELAF